MTNISPPGSPLTRRQDEALELVLKGLSITEMQKAMGITQQGVNFHLRDLCRKYRVAGRFELFVKLHKMTLPGLEPKQLNLFEEGDI